MTTSIGGHRLPGLPQSSPSSAQSSVTSRSTAPNALHGNDHAKKNVLAAHLQKLPSWARSSTKHVVDALGKAVRHTGHEIGDALKNIRRPSGGRPAAARPAATSAQSAVGNHAGAGPKTLQHSVEEDVKTIVDRGKKHGATYLAGLVARLQAGTGKASVDSIVSNAVYENTKFLARVLDFKELASSGDATLASLKQKIDDICNECVAPPSDGGFGFGGLDASPSSTPYDDVKINISGQAWTQFQDAKASFDKLADAGDRSQLANLFEPLEKEVAKLLDDHVSH